MAYIIEGRVWVFGHNINTDLMCPGVYQWGSWEDVRPHVLEAANPEFPKKVAPGDIVVGGKNFGCGSSREKAPRNLKNLGVSCIMAESFGRIFFRNCVAIGLPIMKCDGVSSQFQSGEQARIDLEGGSVENCTQRRTVIAEPLSAQIITTLREGGILSLLKK